MKSNKAGGPCRGAGRRAGCTEPQGARLEGGRQSEVFRGKDGRRGSREEAGGGRSRAPSTGERKDEEGKAGLGWDEAREARMREAGGGRRNAVGPKGQCPQLPGGLHPVGACLSPSCCCNKHPPRVGVGQVETPGPHFAAFWRLQVHDQAPSRGAQVPAHGQRPLTVTSRGGGTGCSGVSYKGATPIPGGSTLLAYSPPWGLTS